MFKGREVIRPYIRFYGWVQAVGFRWRAMQAAEHYGTTGWVRNEYDDSVSMEIQGTEEAIDKVIMSIESGRYVQIENMDVRVLPVDETKGFFRTR